MNHIAPKRYITNRDITPAEFPWLTVTVPKGTVVDEYLGHTYGCVSNTGLACSWPEVSEQDVSEFCELPIEALTQWPIQ